MAIDSIERVWAAAAGDVICFDGKVWTHLPNLPDEHSNEVIRCLAADRDSNLWCGTTDGLRHFDGQWHRQEVDAQVAAIAFAEHEIWIGTPNGLKRRAVAENAKLQDVIPEINVTALIPGHNDDLWVSTESGLVLLQGESWQTFTVENSGLADNLVQALYLSNQTLWIGTANGLSRLTID